MLLLLVVITAIACSDNSEDDIPTPSRTHFDRVVFMYISGDNDLSGDAARDLEEARRGAKNMLSSDRLLAFVDNMSYARPYILDISGGGGDTLRVFEKDFYASNPDTLHSVLNYLTAKYPADEYGLVLWGHCTGWIIERDTIATSVVASSSRRAYGYDSRGGSSTSALARWMNITQMARALKGLPRLRFIMADCCCMLCVESAYELRHAADYLIGSPAEIPAQGAPYDKLVPALFSRRDSFFRDMVDVYYDHYYALYQEPQVANNGTTSYLKGHSVPLAVVDMQHIEALAEATRNVLLPRGQYNVDGLTYYYHLILPVMYDMGNIMARNLSHDAYTAWREVLDKAVPYRRNSTSWMTSYNRLQRNMQAGVFEPNDSAYAGLSMFVPLNIYDTPSCDYNEKIRNMQWFNAVGWADIY